MTSDKNGKPGVQVRLKGLHTVRRKLADGSMRIHYYAWRGGPRLDPDNLAAEFYAAHAARKARTVRGTNSTLVAALLPQYLADYAGRSPKWLREKRRHVDILVGEFGEDDVSVFDNPAMLADLHDFRDTMKDTPSKANHVMAELSAFIEWCRKRGLLQANLTQAVDRFASASRADIVWSDAEIDAVTKYLSPAAIPLVRAAALTGLDRADLVALNWSDIGEDLFIRVRRVKSQGLAVIPVYDALAEILDALPRTSPKVFTNSKGQPWSGDGFSTNFRRAKNRAGITGKRFKDLRGTAATYFYKRGLSDEDVASIMGWEESRCKIIRREYVTDSARAAGKILQLNKSRPKV